MNHCHSSLFSLEQNHHLKKKPTQLLKKNSETGIHKKQTSWQKNPKKQKKKTPTNKPKQRNSNTTIFNQLCIFFHWEVSCSTISPSSPWWAHSDWWSDKVEFIAEEIKDLNFSTRHKIRIEIDSQSSKSFLKISSFILNCNFTHLLFDLKAWDFILSC